MTSFSISQLAEELGISRELIRKQLRAANVKPAGKRRGYDVFRLRDAIEAIYNSGPQDPVRMSPLNRKLFHEARMAELKYLERAASLCDVQDVQLAMAGMVKTMVAWAMTIPDILERDAGITPAQSQMVEQRIDALRGDLYSQLTAFDDDHKQQAQKKAA